MPFCFLIAVPAVVCVFFFLPRSFAWFPFRLSLEFAHSQVARPRRLRSGASVRLCQAAFSITAHGGVASWRGGHSVWRSDTPGATLTYERWFDNPPVIAICPANPLPLQLAQFQDRHTQMLIHQRTLSHALLEFAVWCCTSTLGLPCFVLCARMLLALPEAVHLLGLRHLPSLLLHRFFAYFALCFGWWVQLPLHDWESVQTMRSHVDAHFAGQQSGEFSM